MMEPFPPKSVGKCPKLKAVHSGQCPILPILKAVRQIFCHTVTPNKSGKPDTVLAKNTKYVVNNKSAIGHQIFVFVLSEHEIRRCQIEVQVEFGNSSLKMHQKLWQLQKKLKEVVLTSTMWEWQPIPMSGRFGVLTKSRLGV